MHYTAISAILYTVFVLKLCALFDLCTRARTCSIEENKNNWLVGKASDNISWTAGEVVVFIVNCVCMRFRS